jgi:quercetin dioxygenase-like cupin family protein
MTAADTQRRAGEYVLGTLAPEARQKFVAEMLQDTALQDLVAQWEQRLAPLEQGISPVEPPSEVWSRIEAAIDVKPWSGIDVSIRADEGTWEEFVPGVEKKQLLIDRKSRTESYLLRLAPGAQLPPHQHSKTEECLMISGDLTIGEEQYGPGDYLAVPAGIMHPAIFTRDGALVYISGEIHEALG